MALTIKRTVLGLCFLALLSIPAFCQVVVLGEDGKEVKLTPEEFRSYCIEIEPIQPNLELAAETRVRGTIKDQSGAPFQNSSIELRIFLSQQKQSLVEKISTDASGRFDLGIVKTGEYRLLLSSSRAFKQSLKLECHSVDCRIDSVLIANPTDQPTTNCPIR